MYTEHFNTLIISPVLFNESIKQNEFYNSTIENADSRIKHVDGN